MLVPALAKGKVAGRIEKANLPGLTGALDFLPDETGLLMRMHEARPCD